MVSEVEIENKKYIIMPKEDFLAMQKAELYSKFEERMFSIEDARKKSEELIIEWAKQK
jgi:RNase P protein component